MTHSPSDGVQRRYIGIRLRVVAVVVLAPVSLVLQRGNLLRGVRRGGDERMREEIFGGRSLVRAASEARRDEISSVVGYPIGHRRELSGASDFEYGLHLTAAVAPRRRPGEHLDHHAPYGPHVRGRAVRLLLDHLRRHPKRAPRHGVPGAAPGRRRHLLHDLFRHAEIRQFDSTALLHQDVRAFHVAVDGALGV